MKSIFRNRYLKYTKTHCCSKRFSSITNFVDSTGLKRCKSAFLDFDPLFKPK